MRVKVRVSACVRVGVAALPRTRVYFPSRVLVHACACVCPSMCTCVGALQSCVFVLPCMSVSLPLRACARVCVHFRAYVSMRPFMCTCVGVLPCRRSCAPSRACMCVRALLSVCNVLFLACVCGLPRMSLRVRVCVCVCPPSYMRACSPPPPPPCIRVC